MLPVIPRGEPDLKGGKLFSNVFQKVKYLTQGGAESVEGHQVR